MKKTILIFLLTIMLSITIIFWLFRSSIIGNIREILIFSGAFIIIGFALFLAISRWKSHQRREATEDELSRKIMTKTSSISIYISIYFWLFIMYMSDKVNIESHTLIGAGILGMSLIFLFSWLGIKIFGLHD